jgi:hypothetical protein
MLETYPWYRSMANHLEIIFPLFAKIFPPFLRENTEVLLSFSKGRLQAFFILPSPCFSGPLPTSLLIRQRKPGKNEQVGRGTRRELTR